VQLVTGESVAIALVDQGDTGKQAAQDAATPGITLAVVKLSAAKQGFAILPRRWGRRVQFRAGCALAPLGAWL